MEITVYKSNANRFICVSRGKGNQVHIRVHIKEKQLNKSIVLACWDLSDIPAQLGMITSNSCAVRLFCNSTGIISGLRLR